MTIEEAACSNEGIQSIAAQIRMDVTGVRVGVRRNWDGENRLTSRSENAAEFADCAADVRNMLDHLSTENQIDRLVGKGERGDAAVDDAESRGIRALRNTA